MKKIPLILIYILISFALKAQLVYTPDGDIIPFSLCDKYKDIIDTSKISTKTYKTFNNDSLSVVYNSKFGFTKDSPLHACGFTIDSTQILLNEVASKYKISEGTVWLYRIQSKSAKGFRLDFTYPDIPRGGYFCLYSNDVESPIILTEDDNSRKQLSKILLGKSVVIEFFSPDDEVNVKYPLITRISYFFWPE